jgi:hypothetical protein
MQAQYEPWHLNEKAWGIKVTGGKFKDTVISIDTVEFEPDSDGMMTLDFHFINKTSGLPEREFNSIEFNSLMEKILNDIIKRAVDEFDQDRDDNLSESNS